MKKSILLIGLLAVSLAGCIHRPPVAVPPLKSNFGNAEEQFDEFSKTFDAARRKNLTAEEKIKLVVEKAKELDALNESAQ